MSHPNDAYFMATTDAFNAHIRTCPDVQTPREEWWVICKHEQRFLDDMESAYQLRLNE